jgi:serine/threonine protein phosphatase PrpC
LHQLALLKPTIYPAFINESAQKGPAKVMKLRANSFSLSHVGRVRQLNEDRYLERPDNGLFVVADGIGGHEAGEIASGAIVDRLSDMQRNSDAQEFAVEFHKRVLAANADIRAYSASHGNATMGSTLVALLVFDNFYRCIWSGDSRAYLLRQGGLVQLSRDHTELQELLDRGLISQEEAPTYPRRNVITRAIGVSDDAELEVVDGHILNGDTFLLCSDGLTTHLSNDEISNFMLQRRPDTICQQLVDEVLKRGGYDNVTVSAIQFHSADGTVPIFDYRPVKETKAGFDE